MLYMLSILLIPGLVFTSSVAGFLLHSFIKNSKKFINYITIIPIFASCTLSYFALYRISINNEIFNTFNLFHWLQLSGTSITLGISMNNLSSIMCALVTTVSLMVHLYSLKYMAEEKSPQRFMINLSFFTFVMLILILAPNLLQLFLGWEGVGLASYLLIGYYNEDKTATLASAKAFIVNRFADIFMIFGIVITLNTFKTIDLDTINLVAPTYHYRVLLYNIKTIDIICISLFIGCMGKSAQILLHVWLPDAMKGPTPVSALIHAATMVTAGIFLLCRVPNLFSQSALCCDFILIIGSVTALYGSIVAIMQTDLKKIIAYSTCSQLGYMFIACGSYFYQGAIFHLLTHGFFKALLFLAAGNVILQNHHEQNINQYPCKLYKKMPVTFLCFIIGSLAITGLPPLSGFYSKEAILHHSILGYNSKFSQNIAFICANTAVLFTSIYSTKIILKVFFSNNKSKENDYNFHNVEKNIFILAPIIILSILASFSGYILDHNFYILKKNGFLDSIIISNFHTEEKINFIPILTSLSGILCYFFYHYSIKIQKIDILNPHNKSFLSQNFDEVYNMLFIKPYIFIANLVGRYDIKIIDKIVTNLLPNICVAFANRSKTLNNGNMGRYILCTISLISIIMVTTHLIIYAK